MISNNNIPIIGYITDASSAIEVIDSNGNIQIKNIGDPIFLNEVINNNSGEYAVITLLSGQTLTIPALQQVVMGPEFVNNFESTASGDESDQINDLSREQSDNSESTQTTSDQLERDVDESQVLSEGECNLNCVNACR
ncbi:hypothetical protein [Endozoicomonas atrinae]|uniref:hypothetical protein n=1 Tax=Endozoicomonas atrinae TaxID=1333660 RepID=UPI0008261E28|nr:hypothetical protein [Endozoicomonas atrinae]